MKGDIIKGPKGFVTFARFWEIAQGSFKPLKLTEDQKGALCLNLKALDPEAFPDFGVTEDLIKTGHVREVPNYGYVGDYFGRDTGTWTKKDCREITELLAFLSVWAPDEHPRRRDAMLNFGEDFACGNGTEKNLVFAEYWISWAGAAGEEYAKVWLAHIYSDPECPFKDKAKAVRWLKEARKSPLVQHGWYQQELASAEAAITRLKVESMGGW